MRLKRFLCLFGALLLGAAETLAAPDPNFHIYLSFGTSNDRLHFDSAGSRQFGKRYGERMLSLLGYRIAESK